MGEYRYSIVRYTRDPIRNEPINIGIIVHSGSEHFLDFWFNRDDERLEQPDRETVRHYIDQLKRVKKQQIRWEEALFETVPLSDPDFLDILFDRVGGQISFDRPRGYYTDDAQGTFEELKARFVRIQHMAFAS